MKIMKSGITFGIIAGLLTFLFGGWSVAVIGSLMGVGLGMGLGGKLERKDPLKIAKDVLPTALTAGAILVILSLYQNSFCLLYTSPSPRDRTRSRMPSSA